MIMVRPDALFLDIDGTILRTDHSLSERVIRAVGAIREAGTLVCPATGRSWEALEPLYDRLSLDGPAVCYNGAFVAEGPGGDALFEVKMDEEAARAAVEAARRRGLCAAAYAGGRLMYEREGRVMDAYRGRVGLAGELVNFDDRARLGFTKMIVFSSHGELMEVKGELEGRFPRGRLSGMFSEPEFLELMGGGVDKGGGLVEVCRLRGIDVRRSAAIGDGWNDLALLEAAGDGWVMGGAPDELKARFPANRRAPHANEDGAARVMEAMLAGREPDFAA